MDFRNPAKGGLQDRGRAVIVVGRSPHDRLAGVSLVAPRVDPHRGVVLPRRLIGTTRAAERVRDQQPHLVPLRRQPLRPAVRVESRRDLPLLARRVSAPQQRLDRIGRLAGRADRRLLAGEEASA